MLFFRKRCNSRWASIAPGFRLFRRDLLKKAKTGDDICPTVVGTFSEKRHTYVSSYTYIRVGIFYCLKVNTRVHVKI